MKKTIYTCDVQEDDGTLCNQPAIHASFLNPPGLATDPAAITLGPLQRHVCSKHADLPLALLLKRIKWVQE